MTTDYRRALSCFATGVTVVTTRHQDADWGMTCNSFSSVSLEPRLVLWSIRKAAASHAAFTQGPGYTVSVLSAHQAALARQFSTGDMAQRFAGVPLHRAPSGRAAVDAASAWFDCRLVNVMPAGDHDILLGEVLDFGWTEDEGLVFAHSRFLPPGSAAMPA